MNNQIQTSNSVADILLAEKLITQEQYSRLKIEAANKGENVDNLIKDLNLVGEEKYYEARAKLIGVPFASVLSLPLSPEVLNYIAKQVAERFQLIPFSYDKDANSLSVAMADPLDLEALNFIRQKTGFNIKVFQAVPSEINNFIKTRYNIGLAGEVKEALKETEEVKTTTRKEEDIQNIKEAPIAKIISTILEYAMKSRASDIHIEPSGDKIRIRFRIDGILYERLSLPKQVQETVVSRIKILSGMKIDEHRIPQDGRFDFKFNEEDVDLRVSTLPTNLGEKVEIRLLKKTGGVPTLPELGLDGTSLKNLEASIQKPRGMILVCGPTGSGKTTTLYSVLSTLNTTRVNIITLEDPVEYQIPGANQVQINPDVGLTFSTGLRSILRQDPNIILVGEIRDIETTELALQAALTGHLVFSTLHTSSASLSVPRLLEMGAEIFLLASTLNAVIGQRIARKICAYCKIAYQAESEEILELRKNLGELMPEKGSGKIELAKGKGCTECDGTGYLGRVGIFEVMPITSTLARLILQKGDAEMLENEAKKEGMITMKQDGYLKVLKGVTTIDEIIRVAQE